MTKTKTILMNQIQAVGKSGRTNSIETYTVSVSDVIMLSCNYFV